MNDAMHDVEWVPQSCTLPTEERPLRVAEWDALFAERLTACASPALLGSRPLAAIDELRALPLLQLETRPTAWAAWFEGQGAAPGPVRGMLFDQFATMTQAAIAGLGVALLPDYLAAPEIAEGRLAPLFRRAAGSVGAYWLVWPESRASYPPLEAFRAWLATETSGLR